MQCGGHDVEQWIEAGFMSNGTCGVHCCSGWDPYSYHVCDSRSLLYNTAPHQLGFFPPAAFLHFCLFNDWIHTQVQINNSSSSKSSRQSWALESHQQHPSSRAPSFRVSRHPSSFEAYGSWHHLLLHAYGGHAAPLAKVWHLIKLKDVSLGC